MKVVVRLLLLGCAVLEDLAPSACFGVTSVGSGPEYSGIAGLGLFRRHKKGV